MADDAIVTCASYKARRRLAWKLYRPETIDHADGIEHLRNADDSTDMNIYHRIPAARLEEALAITGVKLRKRPPANLRPRREIRNA